MYGFEGDDDDESSKFHPGQQHLVLSHHDGRIWVSSVPATATTAVPAISATATIPPDSPIPATSCATATAAATI